MIFNVVEVIASNPFLVAILGGGLIIPPIIGIMLIHNKKNI
jgi:sorbitol-specific phosphotransferase system component IIBC